MSLSPTDSNNVRALNWNNQNLIPTELRVSQDPRTMFAMIDIVAETTVDGHGGSSVDFPPAITPLPTPTPSPIPPPGGGGATGGLVYFATTSFIGRTRNWNNSSPSWTNVTGTISGTITDFILDPYDPQNRAWCATSTAIYRTTNLDSISPTWTVSQSQAQIETAIGGAMTSFGVCRISATITANGKDIAEVARNSNFDNYTGVTANNGSSWTWTLVAAATNDQAPSAIDFSDHDENIIVVASNTTDANTTGVFRSTNGGSSYTALTSIGTGGATDVLMPYAGNSDDAIIYICTLTGGGKVYKTTNTGSTWTDITPSGFSLVESSPASLYGVFIGDATTVYVCGSDTTSPLWKSTDGGSNWVKVHNDVGANARAIGLWPYDASQIYLTLDDGGPYFSTNGGISFASKLGNWATAVGSANNARTLVPCWTSG